MKKSIIFLIFLTIPFSVGAVWYNPFSWNDSSLNLSGTVLKVPQGGTGATSFNAGECLVGNGTGAITTQSCSAGGSSFAWPFNILTNYGVTNAATGTPIWTQAGINASSTSHFVYASTTYSSFETASTTNFSFGGVLGNKWSDFCVSITGSSDLCDGGDATGGGSGGGLASSTPWTFGSLVVAKNNGSVTTISTSTLKTSELTNDAGFITYAWPFTANTNYVSTTTTLGLLNGLFSTASSTFSGPFRLSSLSNGGLGVFGGLVSSGATTTAGTGLTYSGNAFNVNTTQNITNLSNLTSNGFVKTSGGTGLLSVDTTTYESGLTAGDGLTRTVNDFDCDTASGSVFGCLTSTDWTTFNNSLDALGSGYATTTQAHGITFSTTTQSFNGLTIAQRIIPSTGALTFTPLITGTLDNTGLTNSTISGIALGSNLNSLTNDATLIGSSYNGSAAISDWGLNLANPNTWTVNQTFNYSSSTIYSSFATASTSVLTVSNSINLFNGGAKTTANALCIQLTGSADLCDGADATGSGGGNIGGFTQLATSTSMSFDICSTDYATSSINALGVGTANITVTMSGSACLGKYLFIDVWAPQSGVIGTTTFSGVYWNGQINPGSNVVNGLTDRFMFSVTASSTTFISAKLDSTY